MISNTLRRLIKFGNYSLCVTLPKNVIKHFKMKKGDSVSMDIDYENNQITLNLTTKSQPNRVKKLSKGVYRW